MSKISTTLLVFSLNGLLIERQDYAQLHALIGAQLSLWEVEQRWLESGSVRLFELGRISRADFALRFLQEFKVDMNPIVFIDQFSAWEKDFYPGVRQKLRSLRKEFRIAAVKNSNELQWDYVGGYGREFDLAISSHMIQTLKPDQHFLKAASQAWDLPLEKIIYFDKCHASLKAATNEGVRAFYLENIDDLEDVLANKIQMGADAEAVVFA